MTDARKIAEGLTVAQRYALMHPNQFFEKRGEHHIAYATAARCRAALQDKGLVERPMYSTRLTPLGLTVRAELERMHDD